MGKCRKQNSIMFFIVHLDMLIMKCVKNATGLWDDKTHELTRGNL